MSQNMVCDAQLARLACQLNARDCTLYPLPRMPGLGLPQQCCLGRDLCMPGTRRAKTEGPCGWVASQSQSQGLRKVWWFWLAVHGARVGSRAAATRLVDRKGVAQRREACLAWPLASGTAWVACTSVLSGRDGAG